MKSLLTVYKLGFNLISVIVGTSNKFKPIVCREKTQMRNQEIQGWFLVLSLTVHQPWTFLSIKWGYYASLRQSCEDEMKYVYGSPL